MALQELAGYTLAEVAKHNSEADLWLVVGDAVLDVTAWLSEHPGGKTVLLKHAGRDATAAFTAQGHSSAAKKRMQELQIGFLVQDEEEEKAAGAAADGAAAGAVASASGSGAAGGEAAAAASAVDRSSKKAVWQPDSEASACPTCDTRFLLFSRKHHCRACGKVFCAKCANHWLYLSPEYGTEVDVPQRLCKACFKEVSLLDHSRTFDRWGPADAEKAVVLLHDATLTRRMWLPIAEALAHEYAVYAIDLPGHGSRMEEELDIQEAFAAVRKVIDDEIKPKKALIWGNGTGGYLALTFAATNPECTLGVIATSVGASADTAAGRFTNATFSLAYKAIPNSTLATRVRANLETFGVQVEEELVQRCLVAPGTYFEKWDGVMGIENLENYAELLEAIKCKVLFVNGEKEVRVAEERFLTASKHGQLKTVEGASWLFVLDRRFRDPMLAHFRQFSADLAWGQEFDEEEEPAPAAAAAAEEMVERSHQAEAATDAPPAEGEEEEEEEKAPPAEEDALAQPEAVLEEPQLDASDAPQADEEEKPQEEAGESQPQQQQEEAEQLEEPQLDEPQLDEPQLDEPQLDEPQLDEPQLDEPQLDEPQLDEDALV